MTKQELLTKLAEINKESGDDPEACHGEKDAALLAYINDKDIRKEFYKGKMWYA